MKLSEVPVGMMVRMVGGRQWHSQIGPGAIVVVREKQCTEVNRTTVTFNLISIYPAGSSQLMQYATEGSNPMERWVWNFDFPLSEVEVESITSHAELVAMFPNEKWPTGLNAEWIVRPTHELKLEGVVLSAEARKAIVSVLATHKRSVQETVFTKWGFGRTIEKGKGMALLFYGPPGTGKTKCAEAIAADFGMKTKLIDPALLWSSEPGAAERTIKQVFESAGKNTEQTMLLFDECEVLIADRAQTGQILAAQTNALLSALEHFEGISVFTTNRTPVLDPAFERRLQLKLEFPRPDKALREAIWRALVPKEAPLGADVCFRTLSASELSGGHIKNVLLNAARRAAVEEYESIQMAHLTAALMDELQGMAAFAVEDDTPRLGGSVGMTRSAGRGLEIKQDIKRVNKMLRADGEELSDEHA